MNPSRLTEYLWSAVVALAVSVTLVPLGATIASCSSPVLSSGTVDGAAIDAPAMKACKKGTVACGGACVVTATDPDNCGGCGKPCAPGEVCSAGACGLSCSGGTEKCGASCVVTATDVANCGVCGKACKAGELCSKGMCGSSCTGGTTACASVDGGTASCVDEKVDPDNCGKCGNACATGEVCATGTCSLVCGGGTSLCGLTCVDEQVDPANCGTCGKSCGVGVACSGGMCATSCSAGLTLCEEGSPRDAGKHDAGKHDGGKVDATLPTDAGNTGGCVDIKTDRNNCNGCGKACGSGELCVNGACKVSCLAGQIECAGECVDPLRDDKYCGAKGTCAADGGSAGKVCAAGTACNGAGVCEATCAAPEKLCRPDGGAAYCADVDNDSANCGACAKKCAAGEGCGAGKCALACGASGTLCTPDGGAAYCAEEATDDANCGACGKKCTAGETCSNSKCAVSCAPPEKLCGVDGGASDGGGPRCANVETDDHNCGACGVACPAGQACSDFHCVAGCHAPASLCMPDASVPDGAFPDAGSAYCADFQTDSRNCNGCGKVCPSNETCTAGACAPSCASGTDCVMYYDLTMADVTGSPMNCGGPDFYYFDTTATITWADVLPPGSTVLLAEIVLDWGVNCLADTGDTATATFNGAAFGPPVSLGVCACGSGGPFTNSNNLPTGSYVVGGANSMGFSSMTSVGWIPDANGVFGTVVVQYVQ